MHCTLTSALVALWAVFPRTSPPSGVGGWAFGYPIRKRFGNISALAAIVNQHRTKHFPAMHLPARRDTLVVHVRLGDSGRVSCWEEVRHCKRSSAGEFYLFPKNCKYSPPPRANKHRVRLGGDSYQDLPPYPPLQGRYTCARARW